MDDTYTTTGPGGLHREAAISNAPLFALGQIVATPAALELCRRARINPIEYLNRHLFGDWGDLGRDAKRANDKAVELGARILSAYDLPTGERLWIITEWDRSATALLLPSEHDALAVQATNQPGE